MRINDRSIGDWIGAGTCARGETVGDRVDGEVSASQVALNTRKECDLVGAASVTATAVRAEGGDLAHYWLTGRHANGAESIFIGGVWKQCTQLVWCGLGGKIPICWHPPGDHIANGTTNNVGAKSCRSQRTQ
jgi:hypothetical protein